MAVTDTSMSIQTAHSPIHSMGGGLAAQGAKLPLPVWIYLLAVTIPIGFNAGPLAMTSLRLFLILMIIPITINLFSGKYGKTFITDYLMVLHLAWAGAALAVNNPDQVVQQIGSVGVEFLGGYMIGRAYIRSTDTFVALCKALVLIVCCTMPLALYETLTGRPILVEYLRKLPGATSVAIVTIEGRMGFERVQANFAHPIHFGLFCSVAFSLSFVALSGLVSDTRRYVMSAMIAGVGFLALSSGALLAITAQFALILWAAMFASVKQRWWILVGLFAVAYVVIDILSNRAPIEVFMTYATFSAHNAYWRAIIFDWGMSNVFGSAERGIVGSPVFGIGLADWIRPDFMHSGSMDNFWLVMAVRYGVPGLLFLAIGYVYAIARIMRRNFEGHERLTLIRRAWVFTFLGLTFTLCTVHIWTNIYSFVFFMFGTGIWLITVQPESNNLDTETTVENGRPRRHYRTGTSPIQTPATPPKFPRLSNETTGRFSRFTSDVSDPIPKSRRHYKRPSST